MWDLDIDPKVTARVGKIPEPERGRIRTAIAALANGTESEHVKKLQGRSGYRLRVGRWRVLFDIDRENRVISVTNVGPRGDIYK